MDGVRKKAKYLHDAPDGALISGVAGAFPPLNGSHQAVLSGTESGAASLSQQPTYFSQALPPGYYSQNPPQGPDAVSVQDGSLNGPFVGPQPPISPPYSQANQPSVAHVASTVTQGAPAQVPQFGGPLFDPSDPALFNFDISSLNFGNHYGALELGMLGHMSSGAADTPPSDSMINPLNQAAGMYNPQMPPGPYTEGGDMPRPVSFSTNGLSHDWPHPHSRQGSLQMQTPNNTPITGNIDHNGHRNDSLNGPHAYAIGQGPSSLSSASPASTDVHSGHDTEQALPAAATAFFANSQQQRGRQRSPTRSRAQLQQDNRMPPSALRPIQYNANAVRKRQRNMKWIYEGITQPYGYTQAYHRLSALIKKKYCASTVRKIMAALAKFRPVLIGVASDLQDDDLVHSEKNLQRSLINEEDNLESVALPTLICRRSGEVVGVSKEFTFLTGWKREVLLGKEPNRNVNTGVTTDPSSESGLSTRTDTTPVIAGQEQERGPFPVSIIDLMDESSVIQWAEDFSDLAFFNTRGNACRRVNFIRYRTREDIDRLETRKHNGVNEGMIKSEHPIVKLDGGSAAGAGRMPGDETGLVDCMMQWVIKRDNDLPMLIVMHVSIHLSVHVLLELLMMC